MMANGNGILLLVGGCGCEMMQKNEKYETFCFIKWRVCVLFCCSCIAFNSEPQKKGGKKREWVCGGGFHKETHMRVCW